MTPQELRDKRMDILIAFNVANQRDYKIQNYTTALDALERLDADNGQHDFLQPVLTSSSDLVARFQGTLTERGAFAKFNEESDEFKVAVRYCHETVNTDPYDVHPSSVREAKQEAARELVDVLVTAGGMASYAGLQWTDIRAAVEFVLAKNAMKDKDSHQWDAASKMVVRREATS